MRCAKGPRGSTAIEEVEDPSYNDPNTFDEGLKALFKWQGSIYQILWLPILIYWALYVSLTLLFDYGLSETGRSAFMALASYCSKYTSSIPVIFLLGFFTSSALNRWFSTQTSIPGTAKIITVFTMTLKDDAVDKEQVARQYGRWVVLSWILAMRIICIPLRKKYPTLKSIEDEGMMLSHERVYLEREEDKGTPLPLVVIDWMLHMIKRCNRLGHLNSAGDYGKNIDNALTYKKSCGNAIKFSHKNIPFALTQAVAIAVYAFGLASLMSRQLLERNSVSLILSYFPILHAIQYFLFYAWLKFGQMAANPFGEDYDDIDIKKLCVMHIKDAERLVSLAGNQVDDLINHSLKYVPPAIVETMESDPLMGGTIANTNL